MASSSNPSNILKSTSNHSVDAHRGRARESKAWAGMMMTNMSDDSDSESEHDHSQNRCSARNQSTTGSVVSPSSSGGNMGASGSRASWSQRAAAVGSRPPDTASQNPPTLKLLALKSVKEGGAPLGASTDQPPVSPAVSMRYQIERRQQEESKKREQTLLVEQQREAARNRTPSPIPAYVAEPQKSSHDQLFVKTSHGYGDDADRHGSMINFGGTDGFGNAAQSRGVELRDGPVSTIRPPLHTLPPPRNPHEAQPLTPRTELTQQLGLSNPHARPPSPATQSRTTASDSAHRSLVSASTSSSGFSPPHAPARVGGAGMPRALMPGPGGRSNENGVPLHRGPPPQQMPMSNTQRIGPPPPEPVPLPSPIYPTSMPEPRAAAYDSLTQGRASNDRQGFSNAPQNQAPVRRPSLFRRSKAFLLGDQGRPRQQGNMPGNGQAQRRSLFRRSMALLSGRNNPPPQAQQVQSYDADDDQNAPAPRVRGFVDEKPRDRKSIYMGGGGMGDEWDFQGYGARFWKRFSVAQHKLENGDFADAEQVRKKTAKRRKWTMIISLLGGVTIILAVVAIIIWRENVKSNDIPGALDREKNGAGTDLDQQLSSSSAAAAAAATATQGQNGAAAAAQATDGTTAASAADDTGTTTTRKKKKKKKSRKGDDGERRKRDEQDLISIRGLVERSSPVSMQTLSVEEIRRQNSDWHSTMIRRKQHRRSIAPLDSST